MRSLPHLSGLRGAIIYAIAAPLLLLSQNAAVLLLLGRGGSGFAGPDGWLFPSRRLWGIGATTAWGSSLAAAALLLIAFLLAMLSLRRAAGSEFGRMLAALTVLPVVQIVAVGCLMFFPPVREEEAEEEQEGEPASDGASSGAGTRHIIEGLFAGIGLIVAAVLVSALTFGAYGWGLFVMTPLIVGITTGYLANRKVALSGRRTALLVLAAAALGSLALIGLALEGLFCILLASPLGAIVAILGGIMGRAVAIALIEARRPLMSIALLPAIFAVEGAVPPAVAIDTHSSIDIAAPPAAVWRTLTSAAPIATGPGLVGQAGLAYPLHGEIVEGRQGGTRIGHFSTGRSRERITAWVPGRRLAFQVIDQPPAMEEMSPYRRVHAPHVEGYFETEGMAFDLQPLAGGGTRVIARASHVLRIDPVPYWAPIGRWAIGRNTMRVLGDLKARSEGAR